MGKVRVGYKAGSSYISREVDEKDATKYVIGVEIAKVISEVLVFMLMLPFKIILGVFEVLGALGGTKKRRRR